MYRQFRIAMINNLFNLIILDKMTKVNFLRNVAAIVACLAVTMMTSCGGGSKKSGAEKEAQKIVKDAVTKANVEAKEVKGWASNEYTNQLPKPDIAISSAGTVKGKATGKETFTANFAADATLEQVKAYAEKVKAAGFTKDTRESSENNKYSFSAKNEAGYKAGVFYMSDGAMKMVTVSKDK
jgi:hypothetical protein